MYPYILKFKPDGAHGIEPTRNWTHFLKVRFVVAGGGFHFYYSPQCTKIDKESKEKINFMHTKINNLSFENGFNPVLGSIPRLPNLIDPKLQYI